MTGSYERTSSLWKVSEQIHGVKRSSGVSLHCLILCALFSHYRWTFKCRPMPSFFGPIDNVERAIGKISHLLIKTCQVNRRFKAIGNQSEVCVCVQGERVVLTVFSVIFPSNNVLVPLAPNSVFLKLTWGNPSTVFLFFVFLCFFCWYRFTGFVSMDWLFY